ncbi:MAG: hypothetical protein Q7U54_18740 [Bacteroidales bacterium]|nr:hypothetical protein [Bacteroidales bacterium]
MKKYILLPLFVLFSNCIFAQWQITSAPTGVSYYSIAVNNAKIFAIAGNTGIVVSTDNGLTWQASNNGLTNMNLGTLSVGKSGNIYACGTNAVFVSTDQGLNWTSLKNNLPDATFMHLIETVGKLFVSSNSGLFRSSDNGQAWEKVTGLPSPSVRGIAEKDGFLFAGLSGAGPGTGHGIYRSADLGNTWEENNNGITTDVTDFEILNNRLYAIEVTVLAYSTNLGDNWNNIMSGLSSSLYVLDLCSSGDYIFATQILSGVFIQHKDSTTWRAVPQGLTSNMIQCIAANNEYCFAGSAANGVFRRPLSEMVLTGINENSSFGDNNLMLNLFPNPAVGIITINYNIKRDSHVSLDLVDKNGRIIKVLVNDQKPAGSYVLKFDSFVIPKGVNLLRLQSFDGIEVRKMINLNGNN